jgi:hypothetical protein
VAEPPGACGRQRDRSIDDDVVLPIDILDESLRNSTNGAEPLPRIPGRLVAHVVRTRHVADAHEDRTDVLVHAGRPAPKSPRSTPMIQRTHRWRLVEGSVARAGRPRDGMDHVPLGSRLPRGVHGLRSGAKHVRKKMQLTRTQPMDTVPIRAAHDSAIDVQ